MRPGRTARLGSQTLAIVTDVGLRKKQSSNENEFLFSANDALEDMIVKHVRISILIHTAGQVSRVILVPFLRRHLGFPDRIRDITQSSAQICDVMGMARLTENGFTVLGIFTPGFSYLKVGCAVLQIPNISANKHENKR